MERQDDPRHARSTKEDLLNEGRGVEDPADRRPYTDAKDKTEEELDAERRMGDRDLDR